MKLTKLNIVNRINRLQMSFKVKWEDIVDDLDMGIDKINSWLGTKYPPVSEVLNDYVEEEKTYSYRAGGNDVEFFPNKYFMNIVIPFVITQILAMDEEFTSIYAKYQTDIDENLLLMTAQEINNVPYHLIDAPKGVYFQNPDPDFGRNPEGYFNRKIKMDLPRIQIRYNWNIDLSYAKGFVDKPLPMDNKTYEKGTEYMPSILGTNDYIPMLVDDKATVLAVFLGWSLLPNGEVIPNGSITLEEDVTFYAQWDYDIIRFRYEGNGGTLSNWKPMYVNKNDIPLNGIIPSAGIATRRGYRFIGFDPVKISPNYVPSEDDMEDGGLFGDWELDEINETNKEPDVTFTAQWEREDYLIEFVGMKKEWQIDFDGNTYRYGQEFNLPTPILPAGSPDEFIGWWDNPKHLGDPILKIFESDYGDKRFYAKVDTVSYKITWLEEDGSEILSEPYYRNSVLTPPEDRVKKNHTDPDGSEWRFDFLGFKDITDGSSPGLVTKNQMFVASFSGKIPVTVMTNFKFYIGEESQQTMVVSLQKGRLYNFNDLLGNIKKSDRKYTDGSNVEWRINGFSLQGFTGDSISFPISFSEDVTNIFATYDDEFIEVSYFKTIWNGTSFVVDENFTAQVIQVPNESPIDALNDVDIIGSVIGDDEGKIPGLIERTDMTTVTFKKFLILEENVPTEPSELFDTGFLTGVTELSVVPLYDDTVNNEFKRTITFMGLPTKEDDSTIPSLTLEYNLNEVVDLDDIKNEYANKFRSIEEDDNGNFKGFYLEASFMTAVQNLIMSTNRIIYVKTFSELRINVTMYTTVYPSIPYPSYISLNISKIYRQDIMSLQSLPIDALDFESQVSPPYVSNNLKFWSGWHPTPNSPTPMNVQTIAITTSMKEQNEIKREIEFYPSFTDKQGFVVNESYKYWDTNASQLKPFPTDDINFPIPNVHNFEANHQNTTKTFKNSSQLFIELKDRNPDQYMGKVIGYESKYYRINGGFWRELPASVSLPSAKNTTQTSYELEYRLSRRENYIMVTVRGGSFGLESASYEPDLMKYFVPKSLNWNQLMANLYTPKLSTSKDYRFRVANNWDYHNYPNQSINHDIEIEVYEYKPPIDNEPVVRDIRCYITSNQKDIKAYIKNNNNFTVQLFVNDVPRGELSANQEKLMILTSNIFDVPHTYNCDIKFGATNREYSNITKRTGTIHTCSIMG